MELLDEHNDFPEVNKLYQMINEVYDLINDIFHKLFPEKRAVGCQTVMTSLSCSSLDWTISRTIGIKAAAILLLVFNT